MINENIFKFLQKLEKNNNREWFTENKHLYTEAFNDMLKVVERLIPRVGEFDDDIKTLEPKKCMFRIYRDVRFSKDKSPYKVNFGGYLVKGGKSSGNAGYYLHLENNNSFIAGGIHLPPAQNLKKIRQEIYYHVDEFKKIIEDKENIKLFKEISGDKLLRPPKDFDPEFADIELLKYKSYGFVHTISNDVCMAPGFEDYVLKIFKQLSPMVKFLNRGLEM